MKYFLILLLALSYFNTFSQTKSYLNSDLINSIVLLEKKIDTVYVPHGTGFFLYNYDEKTPVIIVTNEHVLRNKFIYITLAADTSLITYMNEKKTKTIIINDAIWELDKEKIRNKYELIPDSTFFYNKELDIAVFAPLIGKSINVGDSTMLQLTNLTSIAKSQIKYKKDIQLGTDIYFIGFPFSIGTDYGWYYNGYFTNLFSESIPTPLVRNGIIAWKSENNDMFLLDAFSYSGNSGSPVFTRSDLFNSSYLIGIVAGHLPSDDSENVGLARCIWSDKIIELVKKIK